MAISKLSDEVFYTYVAVGPDGKSTRLGTLQRDKQAMSPVADMQDSRWAFLPKGSTSAVQRAAISTARSFRIAKVVLLEL